MERTPDHDGECGCPSGYFVAGDFACVVGQITAILPPIPPHFGGALRAIVTTREAGSDGRERSQHVLMACGRTMFLRTWSRRVLIPRRWYHAR